MVTIDRKPPSRVSEDDSRPDVVSTAGDRDALPDAARSAVRAIVAELEVAFGSRAVVERACDELAQVIAAAARPASILADAVEHLLPAMLLRRMDLVRSLFDFLDRHAALSTEAPRWASQLLEVKDAALARRAVALLARVADDEAARSVDLWADVAARLENQGALRDDVTCLRTLADVIRRGSGLETLLVCSAPAARRLAARILDLDGLPSAACAARVLGATAATFLRPYLEYTRATHLDLVVLTPLGPGAPPLLPSLEQAEAELGRPALLTVLAELGWARASYRVAARRVVALSIDGSFPFTVSTAEATLLEGAGSPQRLWERGLVVAEGTADDRGTREVNPQIQRFRRYNLAHARLLAEIMEIAPLTADKARRLLQQMGEAVDDFATLFAAHTDEGVTVQGVFAGMREAILDHLHGEGDELQSSEVTRLTLMFEDPKTLDEVRTLHGLKRYLHQRGLRLAFRLFQAGVTNHSVDLVVTSGERIVTSAPLLRYVDFEPTSAGEQAEPPLAVSMLIDAFGRYLLHTREASLPTVEVLSYGNEVQVYLHYVNHPAFLRLDLSPPLTGGMIDLEYFGASQYELDRHPDLSLAAIRRLFKNLDFDVDQDGLRLRFRYDKERAVDLKDLVEHARLLCSVVPHLMDLDWTVASLDYAPTSRALIVDAWTDFLRAWGVLPVEAFLTSDRRRVLRGAAQGPAGPTEAWWNGSAPYVDRFTEAAIADLPQRVVAVLRLLQLEHLATWSEARGLPVGQLLLERAVFRPLAEAIARGEVELDGVRFRARSSEYFHRDHEAVRLAMVLTAGGEQLRAAACLASLIAATERHFRFRTTGSIQGYPVERASLCLGSLQVVVFVLRDGGGGMRVALAVPTGVLYHHRDASHEAWQPSAVVGADIVGGALTTAGCLHGQPPAVDLAPDAIVALFASPRDSGEEPDPEDRVWPAKIAAPGRAMGLVRFPTNQSADDFAGAVLVTPAFRPEDVPLVRQAAAIVTTGGGVLSHAGLTALELEKPALIVDARWLRPGQGSTMLVAQRARYRDETACVDGFRVVMRRDLGESSDCIEAGDLVVVDAEGGALHVLGKGPDALALFRELSDLSTAARSILHASGSEEVLELRGHFLRARHQLEKLLGRLRDPALARYAVHALLFTTDSAGVGVAAPDRGRLLACLLANPTVGSSAGAAARHRLRQLSEQAEAWSRVAEAGLGSARNLYEVLFLVLRVLRLRSVVAEVSDLLEQSGLGPIPRVTGTSLEQLARGRLRELQHQLDGELEQMLAERRTGWSLRHCLRARQLYVSLGVAPVTGPVEAATRAVVTFETDLLARSDACRPWIIRGEAVTLGSRPWVGAKAANLGEVARVFPDGTVPRWFAVTDAALREVLAAPITNGTPLREAIDAVLEQRDTSLQRKAEAIFRLWSRAAIPAQVGEAVLAAYRDLISDMPEASVAIRSSAFEEDSEESPWAGQFATYLCIHGEHAVIEHLQLAWAALWSERVLALRARTTTPHSEGVGGGLIIQRMVNARLAGVVLTASPAGGPHQLLIDAGPGLGEGVVSGRVAVDHIVVDKRGQPGGEPLRFDYTVGDKRTRVVRNPDGLGTRIEEISYHQRLRPVLEYVELREVVEATLTLEGVYRHPLDVEFAFEDSRLRILQARPVPAFHAALSDPVLRRALPSVRPGVETHPIGASAFSSDRRR